MCSLKEKLSSTKAPKYLKEDTNSVSWPSFVTVFLDAAPFVHADVKNVSSVVSACKTGCSWQSRSCKELINILSLNWFACRFDFPGSWLLSVCVWYHSIRSWLSFSAFSVAGSLYPQRVLSCSLIYTPRSDYVSNSHCTSNTEIWRCVFVCTHVSVCDSVTDVCSRVVQ